MKRHHIFSIFLVPLLVTGCSMVRPITDIAAGAGGGALASNLCASKKPVIVEMPPAVSGTTLDTADMESVRYGENLKTYSFGRYVDPNDGLVMHEAHTVYRVETTAKWNLHPNMPVNVPGGPVVGIIDPAHKLNRHSQGLRFRTSFEAARS